MHRYHLLSSFRLLPLAAWGITFGSPDGTGHPYVGTLILEQAGALYSCSGTMLSPTVMVTAGHCTKFGGVVNPRTWVKFTPDINWPSLTSIAAYEAYLDDAANGWIKGQAIPHSQFNDFLQFPQT